MPTHINIANNQYLLSERFNKYIASEDIGGTHFYWLMTSSSTTAGNHWNKSHDGHLRNDWSGVSQNMTVLIMKAFSNSPDSFQVQVGGRHFRLVNEGDARRLLSLADEECMSLLKQMIMNAFPQLMNKWQTYITFG
jgi:hypothetical protein